MQTRPDRMCRCNLMLASMDDPIAILGLDESNLESSINDLLNTSHGRDAATALSGDAARTFLDVLQKVIKDRKSVV